MHKLQSLIASIADQSFQSIQKLHGTYCFPRFELGLIKIQGSPGANPASIASVRIPLQDSKIPEEFLHDALPGKEAEILVAMGRKAIQRIK